jgi:hypothetical protein
MKHKKVLFIHIPKTGGTSIASFLKLNCMDQWIRKYPARHDPYFFMQQMNDISKDIFSFAVVRNPYTRTYSYYKHFNYQNNLNVSFSEFLFYVKNKISFPKTPMIIYPQSFYLFDINNKISISKIYRFEDLDEFENDFKIKLPHLRKGIYEKKDYYKDYTDENISLVKQIYNQDFKILNYSDTFI